MKTLTGQIKDIQNDLKNIKHTIESEMAKKIETDLIKSHDIIISAFYAGHKPFSYHRHGMGGLYNSIYKHKNFGTGAYIIVSNLDMEEHYRISSEVVLDFMWNKGIRGLPKQGSRLLTRNVDLSEIFDRSGNSKLVKYNLNNEVWKNPYWSGEEEPYHNIFTPSLVFGKYISPKGTPNDIMTSLVNNWDKAYGRDHCKEIKHMINK